MESKGFIVGAFTAFVIGAGIAIVSVLIFFLVFKVRIDLQLREEYVWNKVQEVPLDLFSMDINGESFVSRMNKVYYGWADKDSLQIETSDIISRQLFYSYETTTYPFEYFVTIGGKVTLSGSTECSCTGPWYAYLTGDFTCSDGCGKYGTAGDYCGITTRLSMFYFPDNSRCFGKEKVTYKAVYPFPLTFNGTNYFTTPILYEVIEQRE